MEPYQKIQHAYDQIVLEYAKRNHQTQPENLKAMAAELVRHVGTKGRIIDIGCGTGRDTGLFEQTAGIFITGIDLSMGMLRFAKEHVKSPLAAMNMCSLGFPNGSFDGVWCCASLLHLPKSEAPLALQEIHRILRSGGMLFLEVQKGDVEIWEESYVPGVQRFFARYQEDEMREILLQCHFLIRSVKYSKVDIREWLNFICIAD